MIDLAFGCPDFGLFARLSDRKLLAESFTLFDVFASLSEPHLPVVAK
jgi:hypothetical protein